MVGSWNPSLGNHSLVSYVYYLIQRGNKQNYKIYLIFCRGTEYCHLYTKGYLPVENFFFFPHGDSPTTGMAWKIHFLNQFHDAFHQVHLRFLIEPWKRVSLHSHQPTHALLIVLRVSVCVSSDACRLPSWNLYFFFFLLLVPKWKQQCLWM